ncbi:hypothetical protein QMK19_21085 [Streptomyces sp. H10-C2]|uniref:hypothetical protein n=1 Tax=unclassified Streptomyces TaxID=2593676 RepID=UPI0024BB1571|nr:MULTISPECIES: hypothetical protein [unclassified Streptomyces]MDJ0344426.1 hypothetical protein [Streptomyces sp. PH10-H1]MDJ0372098.1 hypothetical protein [Streptomyces sp. H10-C2]
MHLFGTGVRADKLHNQFYYLPRIAARALKTATPCSGVTHTCSMDLLTHMAPDLRPDATKEGA